MKWWIILFVLCMLSTTAVSATCRISFQSGDAACPATPTHFREPFSLSESTVLVTPGQQQLSIVTINQPADMTHRYFLYKTAYYQTSKGVWTAHPITIFKGQNVDFFDNVEAQEQWVEITRGQNDQPGLAAARVSTDVPFQGFDAGTNTFAFTLCECDTALECELQNNWDCNSATDTTGLRSHRWIADTIDVTSLCGNNILDTGEECDDGTANGNPTSLCEFSCTDLFCKDLDSNTIERVLPPGQSLFMDFDGVTQSTDFALADVGVKNDNQFPPHFKVTPENPKVKVAVTTQPFSTISTAVCDALWSQNPVPYAPYDGKTEVKPQMLSDSLCIYSDITGRVTKMHAIDEKPEGVCIQWQHYNPTAATKLECIETLSGVSLQRGSQTYTSPDLQSSCASASTLKKVICSSEYPVQQQKNCPLGCENNRCIPFIPWEHTAPNPTSPVGTTKMNAFSSRSQEDWPMTDNIAGVLRDEDISILMSTDGSVIAENIDHWNVWIYVQATDTLATSNLMGMKATGKIGLRMGVVLDNVQLDEDRYSQGSSTKVSVSAFPILTQGWHQVIARVDKGATQLAGGSQWHHDATVRFTQNNGAILLSDISSLSTHRNYDYNNDGFLNSDDITYFQNNPEEILGAGQTPTQAQIDKLTCIINDPLNC
jgi:hypothetical protein